MLSFLVPSMCTPLTHSRASASTHLQSKTFCDFSADVQVRELLGGRTLTGLVNNAGVAFHGPLMHQPIAEFARNVEINLTGTLIVTQACPPSLAPRRSNLLSFARTASYSYHFLLLPN